MDFSFRRIKFTCLKTMKHFLLEYPAYKLLREDLILKLEKEGINVPTHMWFNNRQYLYGLLKK